jgi:alpha-glucosidase
MKKLLALLPLALLALSCTAPDSFTVKMLPGECWWGALDNPSSWRLSEVPYSFPFDRATSIEADFRTDNYSNNCVPFLVSGMGRYIWSDEPFKLTVKDGTIVLEGSGSVELKEAGTTLREAYLAASAAHFPPSGAIPPEEFMAAPQYNTWIELIYNQNQADILRYASDIVSNGFPTGAVFMVDDNWQKYYGNFEFKPERFPDPKGMMDKLHGMGFKVMFWICPFVSPDSPEFRELRQMGALVMDAVEDRPAVVQWWNGFSAVLDMSNPVACEWLSGKLRGMQAEYGVDGFKFDAGDAPNYTPDKVRVHDGKSYGQEHTALWCRFGLDFPYNEFRASWKTAGQPAVMRLCDKKYAWDAVASLVPAMINASMEGHIYVCPDMIGGGEFTSFLNLAQDDIDQENIVRSCQVHAVMPMMQFSVAPWRILSKENLEICRQAAWLHVKLGPYLLEQARNGAVSGEPIVRPMDYAFPGQGFGSCTDQYMLGERYLVAPMLTPGTEREVRLPLGNWQDEAGYVYEGGRTYTLEVPLDRIPMFVQMP